MVSCYNLMLNISEKEYFRRFFKWKGTGIELWGAFGIAIGFKWMWPSGLCNVGNLPSVLKSWALKSTEKVLLQTPLILIYRRKSDLRKSNLDLSVRTRGTGNLVRDLWDRGCRTGRKTIMGDLDRDFRGRGIALARRSILETCLQVSTDGSVEWDRGTYQKSNGFQDSPVGRYHMALS